MQGHGGDGGITVPTAMITMQAGAQLWDYLTVPLGQIPPKLHARILFDDNAYNSRALSVFFSNASLELNSAVAALRIEVEVDGDFQSNRTRIATSHHSLHEAQHSTVESNLTLWRPDKQSFRRTRTDFHTLISAERCSTSKIRRFSSYLEPPWPRPLSLEWPH
jgi:hypothetical protein